MERLFHSVDDYPTPRQAVISGTFPEWLEGNLFRLGPGKWDLAENFSMNHWLDGCALIYKFSIKDGKVEVMSRFLDSEAYQKMTKVQRPVFTEFGTKSYPDPCKNVFSRYFAKLVPLELTDNDLANVFCYEDELYCSSETCHLWKVDKNDLSSLQKVDIKQLLSVNLASSHPHQSADGTLYNLGASFMSGIRYHIVKISPKSAKDESERNGFERASILCSLSSSWKTNFSYYHSFGLSEHYVLVLEQPLLVNTIKLAASGIQGHSLKDCMEWSPKEKTRFHVIDRVSGLEIKIRFQAEAMFLFHHVNTFEEDGYLVADIMGYEDNTIMDKFYLKTLRLGEFNATCPSQLRRFVLPLSLVDSPKGENLVKLKNSRATAVKQENGIVYLQPQMIGDTGYELPTINYGMFNGKNYKYMYGSAVFEQGKYKNSLVKVNIITDEILVWRGKDTMYPSECIYVPRPSAIDEDDGVLLSMVLDVEPDSPDFLLVLDAKTFKEIARAAMPSNIHLPPTIHGCFLKD